MFASTPDALFPIAANLSSGLMGTPPSVATFEKMSSKVTPPSRETLTHTVVPVRPMRITSPAKASTVDAGWCGRAFGVYLLPEPSSHPITSREQPATPPNKNRLNTNRERHKGLQTRKAPEKGAEEKMGQPTTE